MKLHWQKFQSLRTFWPKINLLEIGLLAVLGFSLLKFFGFGYQIVAFPYPVDYGEGPIISQVDRLANFEHIYTTDLSQAPYTITNYPPIYMLIQVPLNWLFGPSLWYGRLISFMSMCAAAALISLTIQKLTQDWLAAVAGGLLLFAIPYVKAWAPLYRIDALALGLSWGALCLLIRRPSGRWTIPVVAVLLTGAIFTRQSYGLAAPLAAFIWLLSRQPRRRAVVLATYVIALGLGLFVLLNSVSSGGFYFNIVTANINEFQTQTLIKRMIQVGSDLPVLILLGSLFLLAGWFRNPAWALAGPYLLGAAVSALTIGKIGSNVNYLLELSAGLCLVIGLLFAWLRESRYRASNTPSKIGWQLASAGLTFVLAAQVYWAANSESGYQQYLLYKAGLHTQNQVLSDLIEQTPGLVVTGEHMGLLAISGRMIPYQPFEMKQLSDSGIWDQTPFLDDLSSGKYPLILMYRPQYDNVHERRWTPEMLALISEHYRYVNNFDQTVVYEWKK
jgi:hypothetical protein